MGALADAALLAAVAAGSLRSAGVMLRAAWPRRSPAAAILLWQALGLAAGLAAVGALLSIGVSGMGAQTGVVGGLTVLAGRLTSGGVLITPNQPLIVFAVRLISLFAGLTLLTVLCGVLVMAFADATSARRRQRELLALLAHGDPKVPGALVIDYPAAAAYCLPGIRSQIVVSAGTLALLGPAELTAVLAHERAHLRARHDLVLIPFTSLRRAFPMFASVTQAHRTVALLVEMMADDRALRIHALSAPLCLPFIGQPFGRHRGQGGRRTWGPGASRAGARRAGTSRGGGPLPRETTARELATALLRFGTAGTPGAPAGTLAAAEGELTARVNRLLTPPPPLPRAIQAAIVLTAALLVTAPLLLLVTP